LRVIFLLENDELTATSIRAVLRDDVESIGTAVEVRRRLDSATPHTIVVGPGVPESTALEVATHVRVANPSIGVIVIRPRLDTATLTAVLRAGARDALAAHDIGELATRVAASETTTRAIRGEEANSSDGRRSARIITVYSPKGGAGKTTTATNLACALQAVGRRVVVLDFDLAFGDVGLSMGLQVQHHLGEAIDMESRLDAAAFEGMVTRHGSGVHVLAAPANPADSERIDAALLERLIDVAATQYDMVIIDTSPTLDERTLSILERSDRVLVITTLDVASIKNVRVGMDTLRLLGFPMDAIRIVLNRSDAKVGIDPHKVPSLLHEGVMAEVPSSRDVPQATNHGEVLVHSKPRHPVSVAMRHIAAVESQARPAAPEEGVGAEDDPTDNDTTPTRRSLWRSRRTA